MNTEEKTMIPNKKQLTRYPNLWKHLKLHLNGYPWKDRRNWLKFMEVAGIKDPDFAIARIPMFLWGWPAPIITVEDLSYRGQAVYGTFHAHQPNEIRLSKDMASRFEATPNNKKGQQLVVVKTLHEMVHWARFNFFRLSPLKVKRESSALELGDHFERKAYRRVLQMRDNEW
jgi:hypothetical protein